MKYLIIEDEDPAAARLQRMIQSADPDAIFLKQIVSIKSAVKWLMENQHPDIIFMDIQLADGNSFEIFKLTSVQCPVIFTTAYNNYAVQAFKVNSIDYLLKPVKQDELVNAISKFKNRQPVKQDLINIEKLISSFKSKQEFQKRIIIRFADTIKAVEIADISYFYTENKINYLTTFESKTYSLDMNLDEVENILDPAIFFRINRQFIVNIKAINKMISYSKSRVKLELNPPSEAETIVSTERSPNFKTWLTGSNTVE